MLLDYIYAMKYIVKVDIMCAWLIIGVALFGSCQTSNNSGQNNAADKHEVPIGIVRDSPFVYMQLKVLPFSPDSVLAKATITNHWNKDMVIYKPMLPTENYTEQLYSVLEKTTYERVPPIGESREDYLKYKDGSSDYIKPRMDSTNFVVLQPGQTIEVVCNLAKKFKFKEFLKKGQHQFKLVYYLFWPYIVDGKQLSEVDSTDNQVKPVYIVASLPKNDDPDLMRVDFKIP